MSASLLSGRVRPTDSLAVAIVVGTFAVGMLAYQSVPAEMLIHYTPSDGVYYGPETLPKLVGLFVIPIVSVVVFGVLRSVPYLAESGVATAPIRPYYQASIVLSVGFLWLCQVALVVANVVFV